MASFVVRVLLFVVFFLQILPLFLLHNRCHVSICLVAFRYFSLLGRYIFNGLFKTIFLENEDEMMLSSFAI